MTTTGRCSGCASRYASSSMSLSLSSLDRLLNAIFFRAPAVVANIFSICESKVSENPDLTPIVPCAARSIRLLTEFIHENTGRYPTCFAVAAIVALSPRASWMGLQSITSVLCLELKASSITNSFFPDPRGPCITINVFVASVSQFLIWLICACRSSHIAERPVSSRRRKVSNAPA